MRYLGTGLVMAAVLAGCGGSGGGSGAQAAGVRVSMTDSPAEDLDTFEVTLSSVAMIPASGAPVGVFSGSVTVDLLDLVMVSELIASAAIPPGTYTGMTLTVTGISATANGGTPQTVILAGGGSFPATFSVVFEDPVAIPAGALASIEIDFDVGDSVTDGGGNTIIVQPVLFAEIDVDEADFEDDLDEFTGTVLAVGSGSFTLTTPAGVITVDVDSTTVFETEDDTFVIGFAGLALLAPGVVVEVDGLVIEIEDAPGGGPEVEGVVTSFAIDGPGGAPDTATLAILEVENDPAGDLTGATSVVVNLDGAAFEAELGAAANAFDVDLGGKMEVEGAFASGTLSASKAQFKKTRYNGVITAVSGSSITLSPLTSQGLAVAGLASRTFSIDSLTEISIDDDLPIGASSLAIGQAVRLKGARNVNTNAWAALEIERESNDFNGVAAGVSSIGPSSFVMSGDASDFGLPVPATLTVVVTADTEIVIVSGGVDTEVAPSELASVLLGLSPTAAVLVEGVLTGPSTITASEIVIVP